jgi:hypothetical protein
MRDLDVPIHHRVKGRPVLIRRLGGLLVAVCRFARCRATSRADQRWAARMIDALTEAHATARQPDEDQP